MQDWSFFTADRVFIQEVHFQVFLCSRDYLISQFIQDQKHPCLFLPGKNGF